MLFDDHGRRADVLMSKGTESCLAYVHPGTNQLILNSQACILDTNIEKSWRKGSSGAIGIGSSDVYGEAYIERMQRAHEKDKHQVERLKMSQKSACRALLRD